MSTRTPMARRFEPEPTPLELFRREWRLIIRDALALMFVLGALLAIAIVAWSAGTTPAGG